MVKSWMITILLSLVSGQYSVIADQCDYFNQFVNTLFDPQSSHLDACKSKSLDYVTFDENNYIIGINMTGMGLNGWKYDWYTLTPLYKLEFLDLSNNNIRGTIQVVIPSLQPGGSNQILKVFDVSGNAFTDLQLYYPTGNALLDVLDLSRLTLFDVSDNGLLTNTIPKIFLDQLGTNPNTTCNYFGNSFPSSSAKFPNSCSSGCPLTVISLVYFSWDSIIVKGENMIKHCLSFTITSIPENLRIDVSSKWRTTFVTKSHVILTPLNGLIASDETIQVNTVSPVNPFFTYSAVNSASHSLWFTNDIKFKLNPRSDIHPTGLDNCTWTLYPGAYSANFPNLSGNLVDTPIRFESPSQSFKGNIYYTIYLNGTIIPGLIYFNIYADPTFESSVTVQKTVKSFEKFVGSVSVKELFVLSNYGTPNPTTLDPSNPYFPTIFKNVAAIQHVLSSRPNEPNKFNNGTDVRIFNLIVTGIVTVDGSDIQSLNSNNNINGISFTSTPALDSKTSSTTKLKLASFNGSLTFISESLGPLDFFSLNFALNGVQNTIWGNWKKDFLIIIKEVGALKSQITVKVELSIICEDGKVTNTLNTIKDSTYPVCIFCPSGASCDGASLVALPNFYLASMNSEQSVVPCFPSEACLGNNTCAAAYRDPKSTGSCGCCNTGFFKNGLKCVQCPEGFGIISLIMIAFAAVVVVGILLYLKLKFGPHLVVFSILFQYFQILYIYKSLILNWSDTVLEYFNAVSVFSFDLELTKPECISPDFEYFTKAKAFMAVPPLFAVILLLVALSGIPPFNYPYLKFKSILSKSPFKRPVASKVLVKKRLQTSLVVFHLILQLLYVSLCTWILGFFSCKTAGPVQIMVKMPAQICGDVIYMSELPSFVAGVIVYVVGIPLYFSTLFYLKSQKKNEKLKRFSEAMLFNKSSDFQDDGQYIIAIHLSLRLLIVSCQVFLNDRAILQSMLILLLIVTYLGFLIHAKPYKLKKHNVIDVCCQAASIITLSCGILFLSALPQDILILTAIVIGVSCILFVVVVVNLGKDVNEYVVKVQTLKRAKSMSTPSKPNVEKSKVEYLDMPKTEIRKSSTVENDKIIKQDATLLVNNNPGAAFKEQEEMQTKSKDDLLVVTKPVEEQTLGNTKSESSIMNLNE